MSGMQRLSNHTVLTEDQSPKILPHASFVGLGIYLPGSTAPTVTVEFSGSIDGEFGDEITMEGTGDYLWPDTDGMNRLYNARYIKITWDSGDIEVFQKG